MVTQEERLMTVAEVAAELNISEQAVRTLARGGNLRGIRISAAEQKSQWRFRPADVRSWVEERTVGRR